ncbi:MAG TPA: hypothetical protein VK157_10035 [Phycisphaerales bacterium]|nr:hypothetical protein [Phycisphaerales bacterium]
MQRMTRTTWVVMATLASASAAMAQLATSVLTLRDGATPPTLLVREVTADGMVLVAGESETAQTQLITWDKIANVQGSWREKAAPYREMATDLWRARVRLERGDALGAEPLLEKHVAAFEGRSGPLAATFWSGVLRCRVSRQAQSAAIVAWNGVVRAGQGEVIFASRAKAGDESRDTAIIDAGTSLAPQLAPIFLPTPALQIVAQSPPRGVETRADRLMQLYVLAAEFELGRKVTIPAREDGDAALALTWDVVAARVGDDAIKVTAKKNLQARLKADEPPRWQEAWVRVALGRLMLASAETEERHLGMAMLLHVPARLADAHPYLAGVALAEVSAALGREGNVAGARATLSKLEAEFPGHPALGWEGLRAVRSGESAAQGGAQ